MQFLKLLLFLIIAIPICKLLSLVVKRLSDTRKVSALKKECGAKITYTRPRLSSLFKLSEMPCCIVETDAAIYAIRFISSGGSRRYMHFAREDFFVTYRRSYFTILEMFSVRRYKFKTNAVSSQAAMQSVKILPQLKVPNETVSHAEACGKPLIKVIILSPEPLDLTYVTKEKTSIKIAFSGDEVNGQRVFTAKNFAIFADRENRASKSI